MSEVYLSREGYEKLQDELKELKESERPTVRQALQRAREFGDLSENAEYSAAKERLHFLEARISKLEETLSRARLLELESIPEDKVYIGATVKLGRVHFAYLILGSVLSTVDSGDNEGFRVQLPAVDLAAIG